ncbi:hypothetical protein LXL04_015811 [Taraxacum kok-saghyz]
MQATITRMTLSQDEQKKRMAISMKAKYDKYWDNVDNMNYLLYVAVVLDPRNKLAYVSYCIELIYGKGMEKSKEIVGNASKTLDELFNHYKGKSEKRNVPNTHDNIFGENSSVIGEMDMDLELEFDKFDDGGQEFKSEVEIYLADVREKRDQKFDLLGWWKANSTKFPILSKLARHVLAMPISTVASESAHSSIDLELGCAMKNRDIDEFNDKMGSLNIDDTNMEWDKGWCELKGSWGELGVLFWIVLALIGYATKDYLNISPSVIYYELHAGCLGLGLVTLVQIFSITDGSNAEKVSSSEEVVTNKRVSDKEASDNGVSEYTKEVLTKCDADVLPLIVSDTDADERFDPDERVDADKLFAADEWLDADRMFGAAADPNGVASERTCLGRKDFGTTSGFGTSTSFRTNDNFGPGVPLRLLLWSSKLYEANSYHKWYQSQNFLSSFSAHKLMSKNVKKLLIEEDEEIDENTYIYDAEFVYEPEDDVEKVSPFDPEEEDDEPNPVYDSSPIYDTDGEEDLIIEATKEEMVERRSFVVEDTIGDEISLVGMNKVIKEVVSVEHQKSFQELTTSRTNEYTCHKNSGSHIFYKNNLFSNYPKEIRIRSFVDPKELFVFHHHVRFKVWGILTLSKPWNGYALHFEGLNERRRCGERLDFTNYKLTNDISVLFSFIDLKQRKDLHITFDKRMINLHVLITYGNGYSPWEVGECRCVLLNKCRLHVLFCMIGYGEFSFAIHKQQESLYLDVGRILYPPKGDMREIPEIRCVQGGGDQPRKEALLKSSYAKVLCCPQTKDTFISSSFVSQEHQARRHEVGSERKFVNFLSKSEEEGINQYEDPSPKYICGRELVVFGFIFFWCVLMWEVMIFGSVTHQLTNTDHDPFFQIVAITTRKKLKKRETPFFPPSPTSLSKALWKTQTRPETLNLLSGNVASFRSRSCKSAMAASFGAKTLPTSSSYFAAAHGSFDLSTGFPPKPSLKPDQLRDCVFRSGFSPSHNYIFRSEIQGGLKHGLWHGSEEELVVANHVKKRPVGWNSKTLAVWCKNFQEGSWWFDGGPIISMIYDGGYLYRGDYITNLYYCLFYVGERETIGMFESGKYKIKLAGHIHQVRELKVAWDWFSLKWQMVTHVNKGKISSFLIDDERAELRSIPFEEEGNDTNMEWDKGWCELKGSWGELGVLFWIILALIGYATKDYLNISPSVIYYELHAGWLGLGLVTLVQIFSITDGSSAEKVSSSEEVVTNKKVSDKEASDNGVSEYTKEVLTESDADVLPLIVSDTDADEHFDPDERVDADRLFAADEWLEADRMFGAAADPNGVASEGTCSGRKDFGTTSGFGTSTSFGTNDNFGPGSTLDGFRSFSNFGSSSVVHLYEIEPDSFPKLSGSSHFHRLAQDNLCALCDLKNIHTAGPNRFARIRDEMKNEDPNHEFPTLTQMFERTRKRTDERIYVDTYDNTARKLNYKPLEDESDVVDPYMVVMNKEHDGYRRLYGGGVTNRLIKKVGGGDTSYMIPEALMESFKANEVERNQLIEMKKEIQEDHEKKNAKLEAMQIDINNQ